MKHKLKSGIDTENAVVHCETREQWDTVTEALGCDWKSDEWDDEGCETCIRLVGNRFSDRKFYEKKGFTIHSFTDVFEPELYDLTKVGRAPEGVMVEVSDYDKFNVITEGELLYIDNEHSSPFVFINWDGGILRRKYARHPKPEPKTRPMNFEEVCDLREIGATFHRSKASGSEYSEIRYPAIGRSWEDEVLISGWSLSDHTHYTLPDDTTERKLEVEI